MSEQHSPLGTRRVETTTVDRASTDFRSPDASTGIASPGQANAASPTGPRAIGRRRSDRIVAASAATQAVVDQASAIARSETPVLVVGPSGSGRKHLARAIHQWSARAGGPLDELQRAGGDPTAGALRGWRLTVRGACPGRGRDAFARKHRPAGSGAAPTTRGRRARRLAARALDRHSGASGGLESPRCPLDRDRSARGTPGGHPAPGRPLPGGIRGGGIDRGDRLQRRGAPPPARGILGRQRARAA
ncbi:sigma 54-interacting transcriptional regulator [Myxococcota bacterium]|nr:sigma 54-interacting transcriptional regulator [Myxococcota bacterium]